MQSYYVYILASLRNGTLYVGVTNDLARRVHEHKNGSADGFTKTHNVKMPVWFGETPNVADAIQHEKRMKKWPRAWKINLIERQNPQWRDLYLDIIS